MWKISNALQLFIIVYCELRNSRIPVVYFSTSLLVPYYLLVFELIVNEPNGQPGCVSTYGFIHALVATTIETLLIQLYQHAQAGFSTPGEAK